MIKYSFTLLLSLSLAQAKELTYHVKEITIPKAHDLRKQEHDSNSHPDLQVELEVDGTNVDNDDGSGSTEYKEGWDVTLPDKDKNSFTFTAKENSTYSFKLYDHDDWDPDDLLLNLKFNLADLKDEKGNYKNSVTIYEKSDADTPKDQQVAIILILKK